MITLFHRPRTRSSRFIFLLEELEAPYQVKLVTTRTADGTGAVDPANPHPHGKVPAIIDDGILVFESPAIALYLTDKYPLQRLGPVIGDHDRGAYLSWLCYYSGVLEPAFISRFMNIEPRGTAGWVPVEEAILAVTNALTPGPYMLGERFSAVDVLYGTTFAMFAKSPMMPKSAVIDEYVKRIVARPAFARAQARDGG